MRTASDVTMIEQTYFSGPIGDGLSLAHKVEASINAFLHYEAEALNRDPVDGYYLCDSFGKDSCVILDLAKKAGVRFQAHHNLTTVDPPELMKFGRRMNPDTIRHRPDKPLLKRLIEKTTLPTRQIRWCCEEYKERGGIGVVKVFGVRAAESPRRKSGWRTFHEHKKTDSWILNPILHWTDADVWNYIKSENVPYCELYDEGFKRLGCVGCPMSSRRREEFERWPGMEMAWRRAIGKFYENIKDKKNRNGQPYYFSKFESSEHLWRWWMEELPDNDEDECQMGLF